MDGGATAQGLFAVVICVVMATHRVCIGNYAGMSIEYITTSDMSKTRCISAQNLALHSH